MNLKEKRNKINELMNDINDLTTEIEKLKSKWNKIKNVKISNYTTMTITSDGISIIRGQDKIHFTDNELKKLKEKLEVIYE